MSAEPVAPRRAIPEVAVSLLAEAEQARSHAEHEAERAKAELRAYRIAFAAIVLLIVTGLVLINAIRIGVLS